MANITDVCRLIKGSIYHHFKNKEGIGLESLKYIYKIAYQDDLNQKIDDYFLNSEVGCLLGNLALEF